MKWRDMKKIPRIVIPHSWSHNMGDAAMLMTIDGILGRIAPGSSVVAFASHPAFTKEKCAGLTAGVEKWPWPIPRGRPSLAELAIYPAVFLGNMLSALIYRLSGRKVFIFNSAYSAPLSALFECDIVISPGGDFIGPNYFFITTFGEMIMARILGKKLVICAQTIGPFEGALNGHLAGLVLGTADLVIAREGRTARELLRFGVRKTVVTTDLAFSFPPPEGAGKRKRQVVICPKKIKGNREAYAEAMRKLAERVSGEGFGILFLASDRYDTDFQREIASGIRAEHEIIPDVLPPSEMARRISESEFIVGSRMHAIILGSLSHTPFVAIGDSFKFGEILDPLCPGSTVPVSTLDDSAIETIIGRIKSADGLRKEIRANFPQVKRKSQENEEILGRKFAEWGF